MLLGPVVGLTLFGCAPSRPEHAQPTLDQVHEFVLRQFDPEAYFLPGVAYPEEVAALSDSDLVPLACTPEYFSWSGSDHVSVNPSTGERHPLTDRHLQRALEAARELDPESIVVSISLCEAAGNPSLVFLRVGPCGGGCAGIPTIAELPDVGGLSVLATIAAEGDGAYFDCLPLSLTNDGRLYLSCLGEGTAFIRRVDVLAGDSSIILRCQVISGTPVCTKD